MALLDDLSTSLGRHYLLATDGGCRPNPGAGGWGCVKQLREGANVVREAVLSGGSHHTTNNAMELTAAAEGLRSIRDPSIPIIVLTDSNYVRGGITAWLPGWQKNGWRNSAGEPVANRALWEELAAVCPSLDVRWIWVKGHSGDPLNERADAAATAARAALPSTAPRPSRSFLQHGFEPEYGPPAGGADAPS